MSLDKGFRNSRVEFENIMLLLLSSFECAKQNNV